MPISVRYEGFVYEIGALNIVFRYNGRGVEAVEPSAIPASVCLQLFGRPEPAELSLKTYHLFWRRRARNGKNINAAAQL